MRSAWRRLNTPEIPDAPEIPESREGSWSGASRAVYADACLNCRGGRLKKLSNGAFMKVLCCSFLKSVG